MRCSADNGIMGFFSKGKEKKMADTQKPVYVINGFLDSGKSSFFSYTLGQPYFKSKEKDPTLLILCEEGEVGYEEKLLKWSNTVVETIENEEDFTPATLMALEAKHRPCRVLIEYNGMWDFRNFRLPKAWKLEQEITTIDASTFAMYFSNMKSLLAEQVRNSELIMFNRCDGIEEKTLLTYKRNIRAINQKADLIFEDANGEIDMTTEEDLPYDVNDNPIVLEGLNYGIWYLDAMEHPARYLGKRIQYTGMAMVPNDFPKDYFVPGRMAMTCCAQDMQFLGYGCRLNGKEMPTERDWVRVTGTIEKENFAPYEGEGIIIVADQIEKVKEPASPVIDFSAPQG